MTIWAGHISECFVESQELFIVGSLGVIIVDVLRQQLLFGPNGLPLGILTSGQRFTELKYLFSPEFRFGLAGIISRPKRLLLGLLIFTSALIALLAGPSTALLLIPTLRDNWLAGGLTFWMVGTDDDLWPSELTLSTTGGSDCDNTTPQIIETEALNSSGCIWAGHSALSEYFKAGHLGTGNDMTFFDGMVKRDFFIHPRGPVAETYVEGNSLAAAVLAKDASRIWWSSVLGTPKSSRHHRLFYRIRNATTSTFSAWAPVVRTVCAASVAVTSKQSGSLVAVSSPKVTVYRELPMADQVKYPYTPEYDWKPDVGYLIATNFSVSSSIYTQWVPVPDTATLSDGSTTSDLPSALLSIVLPIGKDRKNRSTGVVYPCSVDARWAKSTYQGSNIALIGEVYSQTAQADHKRRFLPNHTGYDKNFLPINDGSWRKVKITNDWLYVLTPPLSNGTSGQTVLSNLLAKLRLDNSTGEVFMWSDLTSIIESITATVVADGMSRLGFTANAGPIKHISDSNHILPWNGTASNIRSVLGSNYVFQHPAGPANGVKISIFVGGYAYSADSVAYYLALTVLLVHAAIAFSYMAYTLKTRECCNAWNSFLGLFILAATSEVSEASKIDEVLQKTSSGVEQYRTLKTAVRIRTLNDSPTSPPSSENDIKLLFGKDKPPVNYQTIEFDKKYR